MDTEAFAQRVRDVRKELQAAKNELHKVNQGYCEKGKQAQGETRTHLWELADHVSHAIEKLGSAMTTLETCVARYESVRDHGQR